MKIRRFSDKDEKQLSNLYDKHEKRYVVYCKEKDPNLELFEGTLEGCVLRIEWLKSHPGYANDLLFILEEENISRVVTKAEMDLILNANKYNL